MHSIMVLILFFTVAHVQVKDLISQELISWRGVL